MFFVKKHPVINSNQVAWTDYIIERFGISRNQILYNVPASLIIEIDFKNKNDGLNSRLRHVLLNNKIDLLTIDKDSYGKPEKIIVETQSELAEILPELGLSVYCYEKNKHSPFPSLKLIDISKTKKSTKKSIINKSQNITLKSLVIPSISIDNVDVFQEISIDSAVKENLSEICDNFENIDQLKKSLKKKNFSTDFISNIIMLRYYYLSKIGRFLCNWSYDDFRIYQGHNRNLHPDLLNKIREIQKIYNSDALKKFYKTSSFDILVCTKPPESKPIMAIEFDGPHHESDEQKRKDNLKDFLCEEAGLPLIRVTGKYLPQNHHSLSWYAKDNEFRTFLIRYVVRSLSSNYLYEQKIYENYHTKLYELKSDDLNNYKESDLYFLEQELERELYNDLYIRENWHSGYIEEIMREIWYYSKCVPIFEFIHDSQGKISAKISLQGNKLNLPEKDYPKTPFIKIENNSWPAPFSEVKNLTKEFLEFYVYREAADLCRAAYNRINRKK